MTEKNKKNTNILVLTSISAIIAGIFMWSFYSKSKKSNSQKSQNTSSVSSSNPLYMAFKKVTENAGNEITIQIHSVQIDQNNHNKFTIEYKKSGKNDFLTSTDNPQETFTQQLRSNLSQNSKIAFVNFNNIRFKLSENFSNELNGIESVVFDKIDLNTVNKLNDYDIIFICINSHILDLTTAVDLHNKLLQSHKDKIYYIFFDLGRALENMFDDSPDTVPIDLLRKLQKDVLQSFNTSNEKLYFFDTKIPKLKEHLQNQITSTIVKE